MPSARIKQYIPVIRNRRGYFADVPDLDEKEDKEQDTQAESYGGMADGDGEGQDIITAQQWALWADIMILAPIDADTMGRMVHGLTGSAMASLLRAWDVSKKIILIPGMSRAMWEHPITMMQISTIRQKFSWIRVLEPILWHYEDGSAVGPMKKVFLGWNKLHEVVDLVLNIVEVRGIGEGEESMTSTQQMPPRQGESTGEERKQRFNKRLPPEIWSLVFTHMGDWELAKNLGVYTPLSPPKEWERCMEMVEKDFPPPPSSMPPDSQSSYRTHLESLRLQYAILTQPVPVIISMLEPHTDIPLTPLSVKLIVKFNYLSVLRHIAEPGHETQYDAFTDPVLPHKASYNYNRTEILTWWKQHLRLPGHPEPHRHYGPEAIDGASKQGFIEVLDWWRKSGLCMKYTEAALEQASARGFIHVLEWWKAASLHTSGYGHAIDEGKSGIRRTNTGTASPSCDDGALTPSANHALRLKVGKSLLTAAQHGHANVIRWWVESGIPYSHEEGVAKVASAYGHVDVLETWKELKGDKFAMCYDSQVLVGPTKNGFVRVLEWWRRQTLGSDVGDGEEGDGGDGNKRLKVEYKTCDIEEALEDSVEMEGCEGEGAVRRWWSRNGLNLEVATGEWMELKSL